MTKLDDLVVYQVAMEIGDDIYKATSTWPFFDRDTLGKQIVRSADSIALNIAEGYGRFHFKENKNFCFYSRGSQFETKSALTKAKNRNLVDDHTYTSIIEKLERFHKLINGYIKSIGNRKVRSDFLNVAGMVIKPSRKCSNNLMTPMTY